MKILYFGFYNSGYSRNRNLIQGLISNGVEVIECNVPKGSWRSFPILFWKYLRMDKNFDALVVGFPGQEAMLLARFLTRKPIIFDAFTSHFGGYILDRKRYSPKSLMAKYYWYLDKFSCLLADKVLLDTNAHVDFFGSTFKLSKDKFNTIYVGTDEKIFQPFIDNQKSNIYTVHFHGNFIPLQGAEYIIMAAELLKEYPIQFQIVGRGQTFDNIYKQAKGLGLRNIQWIEPVPYENLPSLIQKANLCLGIFGDTLKSNLVIPNKIYEYAAMGKPIITADTRAIKEIFKDNENIFLCSSANPRELADKILYIKDNSGLAFDVGNKASKMIRDQYNPKSLGAMFLEIIKSIHE